MLHNHIKSPYITEAGYDLLACWSLRLYFTVWVRAKGGEVYLLLSCKTTHKPAAGQEQESCVLYPRYILSWDTIPCAGTGIWGKQICVLRARTILNLWATSVPIHAVKTCCCREQVCSPCGNLFGLQMWDFGLAAHFSIAKKLWLIAQEKGSSYYHLLHANIPSLV